MAKIDRQKYASMYGPTVGDKIRLADTELFAEIERDYTIYGEENKFGGGKTMRDGMAQSATHLRNEGVLDLVITNATIIDYTGIYKADIGIKDGKISGIGKAGNPNLMDGVTSGMVIGASTEALGGEGHIFTAGAIDTHIHYICPQQVETALAGGTTTFVGGGTGPNHGTLATTITPGAWNIRKIFEALDELPMNFGVFGKGNSSSQDAIVEQIEAGVFGLKLHEDWGSTPSAIDTCLTVCDKYDVQATIHTDTLNEGGFVEDTMRAINGRTIHTFHTEGAGGGHAPDIITVASYPNVLPASTNPTKPFTVNTIDEHLDMLMVCHHLDKNVKEDVSFADSRIRRETIAAEDILHDKGIFSVMSSDSQAMGRPGEVLARTFQTADKMKKQFGPLPEDEGTGNDNFRIKRYISKVTINPAIAHGIQRYIGSIEVGKMADLVMWRPDMFGAKPEMVIKGGFVSYAKMGDPNASIPTPQPILWRPMFGSLGKANKECTAFFVSKVSIEKGIVQSYGLGKKLLPAIGCRNIGKADMIHNNEMPKLEVNPQTHEVKIDGEPAVCDPIDKVSMGQLYFMF